MKIACFETENWEKEILEKELKNDKILYFKNSLNKSNLNKIKDIETLVIFIYSNITKEIIDKLPNLKLIVTKSTGFDHIDINYAREKKIKVTTVPNYGENTVAEHTFALLLALSRKIYPSVKQTHENEHFETNSTLRGFDLQNKTLGIIGGGSIGMHFARMAKGFEMKILVYDINKNNMLSKSIGFEYVSMNKLLKNSDVISVHVPYNKFTHHLINKETISKMKNEVNIINTARGSIIDTHALYQGLKKKKIAGAALDVLEEECEILEESQLLSEDFKKSCDLKTVLENHKLMKMDNVIITPHNAFNSQEALNRILHTTIDNIKLFKKKKIINCVN